MKMRMIVHRRVLMDPRIVTTTPLLALQRRVLSSNVAFLNVGQRAIVRRTPCSAATAQR
jgi:hypothetical protein